MSFLAKAPEARSASERAGAAGALSGDTGSGTDGGGGELYSSPACSTYRVTLQIFHHGERYMYIHVKKKQENENLILPAAGQS